MKATFEPTQKGIDILQVSITDTPLHYLVFNLNAPILENQQYINLSLKVKFWIFNKIVSISFGLH